MGGASVHLLGLMNGAKSQGHTVKLFFGGNGILKEKASEKDLDYSPLKYLRRSINPYQDFLSFLELRKHLKKFNPDVVHLHSSKAGIIGRLAARSLKIKCVFTAHGWSFTDGVGKAKSLIYTFIEWLMAFFCQKIIAVSDYDKKLAINKNICTESKIVTIHNGMPALLENKSNFKNNRNIIPQLIMVARFEEQKDQEFLIKTLFELKHIPWQMNFIGDGPSLKICEKFCDDLNLKDRFVFHGSKNNVSDYLSKSDIFLLVTKWEGLPLTIIEAMRAKLPVIATDVGGISELIDCGVNGFVYEKGSVDQLKKCILTLLEAPSAGEDMGEKGFEIYQSKFTEEKMIEKTLQLYKEII